MKKLLLLTLVVVVLATCKKTKFSPEGPTDVRIKNKTNITFNEVIVNTSGGIDTLGTIIPGGVSEYYRFDKAFPKAEISARINNVLYSTGAVNYFGMTYIGQAKITYTVYILSGTKLAIDSCILDAPLDLK
jgi:hypothetical protein